MSKRGVLSVESEVFGFLSVGGLVDVVAELIPEVGVFLDVLDKDLLVVRQNRGIGRDDIVGGLARQARYGGV